jgi:hypothetical protein
LKRLRKQKILINIEHIKGHQDCRKKTLTHNKILNVEADKLATESLLMKTIKNTKPNFATASIMINELLLTADCKKNIRSAYLSMDLREYMLNKNNWTDSTIDNIWWEVHKSSIRSLSTTTKRLIQKFIRNKLPTNYRQNIYYSYKPSKCRKCNSETETQEHIFKCTRTELKNKYLMNLCLLLKKIE